MSQILWAHESSKAAPTRLKHAKDGENSPDQLGINYHTVAVRDGHLCCHQSTLTVSAEDRDGVPFIWSGQAFRGEVRRKKPWAEHAACMLFLADPAAQETAANMEPPNPKSISEKEKQRIRAKRAASAKKRPRPRR